MLRITGMGALALASSAFAQLPQYSVEILPQIQTPNGLMNAGGVAMNDLGWATGIVGWSTPTDPYAYRAAVYRPGLGWQELGLPSGLGDMRPVDITNDGLIVGYGSPESISIGYAGRTWTWENGQFTLYPQWISGRHTAPGLTNENRRLIGGANDGTFIGVKAVEFVNGATVQLLPGIPGSNNAIDVNNNGVILGSELLGVFLWTPGAPRWYFTAPSGLPYVDFNAINDRRDAVAQGRPPSPSETRTALVWLDGTGWQVLPRNARRCNAKRINNMREVIGTSQDNTGAIGNHAWYWRPGMGSVQPLEYLIADPPSIYAVSSASDINEKGEILAGISNRQTGQGYTAILRPILNQPLHLDLASSVPPALQEPGVPQEVKVRILEGTDTLVAGSPTLHYRLGPSGAFTTVPMQEAGPAMFTAELPAATCADAPEFYISAQATTAGLISLPAGAPASVIQTTMGQWITTAVIDESFETGSMPAGWSATGLWHVTNQCSSNGSGQCYDSGNGSAYYGIAGQCNYDTGGVNEGTLTSPPVTLPTIAPGGEIRLTYCSNRGTDSVNNTSKTELLVNGVVVDTPSGWNPSWERRVVNLTQYAGQSVVLEWRFSTGIYGTDARGWNIGSVRLQSTNLECNATSCYANCDGSTAAPLLNTADFGCFLNKFAAGDPYANCDQSTGVPQLNVADFGCFLNRFASGCP